MIHARTITVLFFVTSLLIASAAPAVASPGRSGEAPAWISGDYDDDGDFDFMDVVYLFYNLYELGAEADVNQNGCAEFLDVVALLDDLMAEQ